MYVGGGGGMRLWITSWMAGVVAGRHFALLLLLTWTTASGRTSTRPSRAAVTCSRMACLSPHVEGGNGGDAAADDLNSMVGRASETPQNLRQPRRHEGPHILVPIRLRQFHVVAARDQLQRLHQRPGAPGPRLHLRVRVRQCLVLADDAWLVAHTKTRSTHARNAPAWRR